MSSSRITFASASKPAVAEAFLPFPIAAAVPDVRGQETLREIYRIAYERACAIHRPSRWKGLYQPSMN
jgi:hypothetical protein